MTVRSLSILGGRLQLCSDRSHIGCQPRLPLAARFDWWGFLPGIGRTYPFPFLCETVKACISAHKAHSADVLYKVHDAKVKPTSVVIRYPRKWTFLPQPNPLNPLIRPKLRTRNQPPTPQIFCKVKCSSWNIRANSAQKNCQSRRTGNWVLDTGY